MPKLEKVQSLICSAAVTPAILKVEGLNFRFPQRALFTDWSTRIPPGVTLLCGGEGTGKTTLLRLLAGVLPAQGGRLAVNGIGVGDQPAAYRKQVFWADPRSDAHDQVAAADYLRSVRELHAGFDPQKLAALVDRFALAPHLEKPMFKLSTGSRRKVWLAAAFASGAAVTLLDEPFAGLDKASIGLVMAFLEDAAADRARALVVAHHEAPGNVPLAATIDLGE